MSSLFALIGRSSDDYLVRLPAYCVPAANEPDYLRSKREAQLQWMREKGVVYLGNPTVRIVKAQPPKPQPAKSRAAPLRLVTAS